MRSRTGGEKGGKRQETPGETGERRRPVSASRRNDQERGSSRLLSGGQGAKQGIANRSAGEEESRQSKVVPVRNEGKTTRKRRAS